MLGHESYGIVPPEWYFKSSKSNLLWMIPKSAKRVLEIGCAEGNLGGHLKELYGAEVWGIELNQKAAKKAQERLYKVYCGDAAEAIESIPPVSFDCIVMFDVLEHMTNPELVLRKSKRLLSENGVIALCVPNVLYASNLYRMLVRKDWEYISHGVLDVTHYRFFTKKSLIRLIRENGYKIEAIKGFEPLKGLFLIPFYVINLLSFGYYNEIKYTQFAAVIKRNG